MSRSKINRPCLRCLADEPSPTPRHRSNKVLCFSRKLIQYIAPKLENSFVRQCDQHRLEWSAVAYIIVISNNIMRNEYYRRYSHLIFGNTDGVGNIQSDISSYITLLW